MGEEDEETMIRRLTWIKHYVMNDETDKAFALGWDGDMAFINAVDTSMPPSPPPSPPPSRLPSRLSLGAIPGVARACVGGITARDHGAASTWLNDRPVHTPFGRGDIVLEARMHVRLALTPNPSPTTPLPLPRPRPLPLPLPLPLPYLSPSPSPSYPYP